MDLDAQSTLGIINVVKDIAQNEIRRVGFPTFVAAIVQKVNADGTVDVYIPPNKDNMVTGVLNKTGEMLEIGDSVEIETKSGSLSNCWISIKHGTNVQGTYGEVEDLSTQVVLKVSNGRLSTTQLYRPAKLGNSFTIIADDINLDGYNINLNGTRGITITSPYFSVTKTGVITCTSGKIGGWSIDSTRLSSGSGTNYVGLDSGTQNVNYAIWAGNSSPDSAPFSVTRAGTVKATNADVTGAIKATSGTFGNGTNKITIGTNNTSNSAIYSGSKSTLNSTNEGFYIGTNGIALGAYNSTTGNPFQVTNAGKLTARDVSVSGEITATSGTIGGCSISNGVLQIANANIGSLSVDKITAGSNSAAVSFSNITAIGGNIAGWVINNEAIYNGKGIGTAGSVGMSSSINGWAFWAGNGAFRVTQDGALYSTSGSISGGLITSGINASNITAGRLNISDGSGHYLRMGFSEGKNPSVSGLNVGTGGIACTSARIRSYGYVVEQGGSQWAGMDAEFGVRDYSGNVHYFAFKEGLLYKWEYK